ncbi:MAG: hypothetical protein PUC09_05635 [Methanobrevibacter wolinii]|nr:hypothetical protein [Methanobrevibacter wolinii]
MGIFSRKTEEEKKNDEILKELLGGFTSNDAFKEKLEKHELNPYTANTYYKKVLQHELKNKKLKPKNIEKRLDELLDLDVELLYNKFKNFGLDTSNFKTQKDIDNVLKELKSKANKKIKN